VTEQIWLPRETDFSELIFGRSVPVIVKTPVA
jgi:hypothetical protein